MVARRQHLLCASIWAVLAWGLSTTTFAGDLTRLQRYFEELRSRGLYAVGERYALDELDSGLLDAAERAQFSIELSRCYESHAEASADADERAALQARAEDVLKRALSSGETFPRREAVEFRRAMLLAARASSQGWEAEIDPDNSEFVEAARTSITAAIKALENWSNRSSERRSERGKPTAEQVAAGELSPGELNRLRREAEVRMAMLALDLATSAPGAVERASAIVSAGERLKKVRRSVSDRTWDWTLRLADLRLARLEGDQRRFLMLAGQAESESPPPVIRSMLVAEQARMLIEEQKPGEAHDLLVKEAATPGGVTDELRSLHVDAILAMWAKADATTRPELWKAAEGEQQRTAGAWAVRSSIALERAKDVEQFGAGGAKIVRLARAAYRSGDRRKSAVLYGRAAVEANPTAADELRFIAASIQVELGDFLPAIESLRPLMASESGARAAQASLLLAYCLGRIAEESEAADAGPKYEAALRDHLRRFRQDSATAGEAAFMLATQLQRTGRPSEALDALANVPAGHSRTDQAELLKMEFVGRALEALRSTETAGINGRSREQWLEDARNTVAATIRSLPTGTERLTLPQANRAVQAARILLENQPPAYPEADLLLDRAMTSAAAAQRQAEAETQTANAEWAPIEHLARSLRIVSLAGQRRYDEARSLLSVLSTADPQRLLAVVAALDQAARRLEAQQREQLGRIELAVLAKLDAQRELLDDAERQKLDEAKAFALAATHQYHEAVSLYESILKRSPQDARILRTTAELIENAGGQENLTRAQEHWKQLAKLYPPGSREWLEARYALAASLLKAGKTPESRKLISTTRIVYPNLGGDDLKSKYETLEKQAAKAE